jgi:hypothetical protein
MESSATNGDVHNRPFSPGFLIPSGPIPNHNFSPLRNLANLLATDRGREAFRSKSGPEHQLTIGTMNLIEVWGGKFTIDLVIIARQRFSILKI